MAISQLPLVNYRKILVCRHCEHGTHCRPQKDKKQNRLNHAAYPYKNRLISGISKRLYGHYQSSQMPSLRTMLN